MDIVFREPRLWQTPRKKKLRLEATLRAWNPTETEERSGAACAVHAILTRRANSLSRTFETREKAESEKEQLEYLITTLGLGSVVALGRALHDDGAESVILQRISG